MIPVYFHTGLWPSSLILNFYIRILEFLVYNFFPSSSTIKQPHQKYLNHYSQPYIAIRSYSIVSACRSQSFQSAGTLIPRQIINSVRSNKQHITMWHHLVKCCQCSAVNRFTRRDTWEQQCFACKHYIGECDYCQQEFV